VTILVDSSVWLDHLELQNERLITLLEANRVVCHPFIVGEITSLRLRHREAILDRLKRLPQVQMATHAEVIYLMEVNDLRGDGLGWIDLHLLASVLLSECRLWTLDPLLHSTAHMLNVSG
jgi:predicted nucleic acid-binding protein